MGVTALGGAALVLATGAACASAVASWDGQRRGRPAAVAWGRRGLAAVFGLVTVGVVALGWALVGQDYSLVYVADHASRDTTWPYRLAGLWGGMAGSLLLWTWMLAGLGPGGVEVGAAAAAATWPAAPRRCWPSRRPCSSACW